MYVCAVLNKEGIDKLLVVLTATVVYWCPRFTNDGVDFLWVGGVGAPQVGWAGVWSLYGLQWLGTPWFEVCLNSSLVTRRLELRSPLATLLLMLTLLQTVGILLVLDCLVSEFEVQSRPSVRR